MIPRTPALYQALLDVAHHEVAFAPGLIGGHPAGFVWHCGGDVPAPEQDALAALEVVHLVAEIPARVGDRVGCEVVLTPQGEQVLSEWDRGEGADHG